MNRDTFTKELAQLLRELEDRDEATTTTETVFDVYQKFCYDDPIGITIQDCNVLRMALLRSNASTGSSSKSRNSTSNIQSSTITRTTDSYSYALSTRLIDGIHQYCYNRQETTITSPTPTTPNAVSATSTTATATSSSSSSSSSSSLPLASSSVSLLKSHDSITTTPAIPSTESSSSSSSSLQSALSLLLVCIHVQIPLHCCILSSSSSMSMSSSTAKTTATREQQQAMRYLGSYLSDLIRRQLSSSTTSASFEMTAEQQQQQRDNATIPPAATDDDNTNTTTMNHHHHHLNGNHNNNNDHHDEEHHQRNPDENYHHHEAVVLNGNGHHLPLHNHNDDNNNNNNNHTDNDSLEEVFAAESDDSDYEFESDYRYISSQQQQQQQQDQYDWMTRLSEAYDPIYLSKVHPVAVPIDNGDGGDGGDYAIPITWDHIAMTIVQLIDGIVPFTSFLSSSITSRDWMKQKLSDTMIQLCLALLLHTTPQQQQQSTTTSATGTTISSIFHSSTVTTHQWQQLGIRILNLFRDITIHHVINCWCGLGNEPQHGTIILNDYLRLIRILLQYKSPLANDVDLSSTQSTTTSETTTTNSSVPTLVGLSSLSALCYDIMQQEKVARTAIRTSRQSSSSNSQKLLNLVQSNIIDLSDELTMILERSATLDSDEDIIPIQWMYISLFQIVSLPCNSASSTTYRFSSHEPIMSNVYAQTLLNSGLFRQWLVIWSKQHLITATTEPQQEHDMNTNNQKISCNIAVQECILELCIVSPTLLGKYAWRLPNLADTVLHPTIPSVTGQQSQQRVATLIWNLLGSQYFASTTSVPTIQWKSSTKNTINATSGTQNRNVVTAETCQERVCAHFQSLCSDTLRILTDWKIRHEHNIMDTSITLVGTATTTTLKPLYSIANEWDRFMNRYFKIYPFLFDLFIDALRGQRLKHRQEAEAEAEARNTDSQVAQTDDWLTAVIQSELSPILRLLVAIQNTPTGYTDTSNVPIPVKDNAHINDQEDVQTVNSNINDIDDDDNDNDRMIKKKTERKQRVDIDQDMKTLNGLRLAVKSLHEMITTTSLVSAAAPMDRQGVKLDRIDSRSMTSKMD